MRSGHGARDVPAARRRAGGALSGVNQLLIGARGLADQTSVRINFHNTLARPAMKDLYDIWLLSRAYEF
jgi:hypothetical protein